MKKHKQIIIPRIPDNHGFSLVELIIGIAILAIIMIPLMSNFYRSMQLNQRAESIQLQSNLAANVLEGIDTFKVKEILEQFNGPEGNFSILDQTMEDVMRLRRESDGYSEYPAALVFEEQETYELGIHGVLTEGKRYDVLITMDSTTYKKKDSDGSTELPILNYYPMPEVVNLNQEANTILFSTVDIGSEAMDEAALLTFKEWGEAYAITTYAQSQVYLDYLDAYESWKAQCEEYEMGGADPGPEPIKPEFETSPLYQPYLNETSVKQAIQKTMVIQVNVDSVIYKISYQAAWTPEHINKSIEYQISEVKYPKTVENIYLLYEPSIYCHKPLFPGDSNDNPDVVHIINGDNTNPIDFFVVQQEGAVGTPYIRLKRESTADNITNYVSLTGIAYENYNSYVDVVFDDPLASQDIVHGSLRTRKKNRIYDITVEIYEYVDSPDITDRYQKVLYTLNSTKEE